MDQSSRFVPSEVMCAIIGRGIYRRDREMKLERGEEVPPESQKLDKRYLQIAAITIITAFRKVCGDVAERLLEKRMGHSLPFTTADGALTADLKNVLSVHTGCPSKDQVEFFDEFARVLRAHTEMNMLRGDSWHLVQQNGRICLRPTILDFRTPPLEKHRGTILRPR